MKKVFVSFLFIIISSSIFAQSEAINQYDAEKKKDGKWIEYLSANWKIVKDSAKASYYDYVYYDHGEIIYGRFDYSRMNKKLEHAGNEADSTIKLKALDGEYKWYDRKGRLITNSCYKNGERLWFKTYVWIAANQKTGTEVNTFEDYTKQYKHQPHTFYVEEHQINGDVASYYVRKGKHGWAAYE